MTTNTHGLRIKDVPFSFSYDAGLAAPAPSRREPMIVDPRTITLGGVERSLVVEALSLLLAKYERISYQANERMKVNIGSRDNNKKRIDDSERTAANIQDAIDRIEAL